MTYLSRVMSFNDFDDLLNQYNDQHRYFEEDVPVHLRPRQTWEDCHSVPVTSISSKISTRRSGQGRLFPK